MLLVAQLFDYLIVIDFESTCWQGAKHNSQEISKLFCPVLYLGMWWSQPKSASVRCGFHMKNPSDADMYLSPDQNSLVPAIIATVI